MVGWSGIYNQKSDERNNDTINDSKLHWKQLILVIQRKCYFGFENWSSQKYSIIRGHRGGPVVALKRELKRCCKLKLVDEYCTGKMCL
jgi:hypothetical protein